MQTKIVQLKINEASVEANHPNQHATMCIETNVEIQVHFK